MDLRHGDCLEVLRTLPDNSVDSLVTDPPYFLTGDSGVGFMGKAWDSLSPVSAIAEAYFRSMSLDLSTVEAVAAPAPVNTQQTENSNLNQKSSSALSVRPKLSGALQSSSLSTSSAPEIAITRAEALVLCSEWLPSLTSLVAKLPSHARLVGQCSLTGTNTRRNTARIIADTLLDDPAWLEAVTVSTSTARTESERSSLEARTGTLSGSRSISETAGLANDAESSAGASASSATTLNRSEFQEITKRITSLRSVKAVTKECTRNPSFIPILSEVFHTKWAREVLRVLKCVKPQKLMRYLARLVTPPGGTVLDPFMGSGSTGLAAKSEGFGFVGIEREAEYFEIASVRCC